MKAAVYNRFLHSMGGGERHSSMLAQVLAEEGHDVDLIGHEDVGKEILADHLGLDLAKVALRIVPDRGETDLARVSAEYDLFVNASYMSRIKARAPRNLYLCYFPTPFDHDLEPWRRRVIRTAAASASAGSRPRAAGAGRGRGRAAGPCCSSRPARTSASSSTSPVRARPARPSWSSATRTAASWPASRLPTGSGITR